ncbi:hypothetical protein BDD12DRAFT_803966 [Trichophaea hybrida]|nr:hypothetical protein BDD12DRAFT_803966 [Trichophaea hybrida]
MPPKRKTHVQQRKRQADSSQAQTLTQLRNHGVRRRQRECQRSLSSTQHQVDSENDGMECDNNNPEYSPQPYENLIGQNRTSHAGYHYTSRCWKYFHREVRGTWRNRTNHIVDDVRRFCKLCEATGQRQYPYLISRGSTKSLLAHLMSKHIDPGLDQCEGEQNGPYVDLEDQDYFLALDTARGFAPDSAILQYALKRRQMEDSQVPGFDHMRFRKKTFRW